MQLSQEVFRHLLRTLVDTRTQIGNLLVQSVNAQRTGAFRAEFCEQIQYNLRVFVTFLDPVDRLCLCRKCEY